MLPASARPSRRRGRPSLRSGPARARFLYSPTSEAADANSYSETPQPHSESHDSSTRTQYHYQRPLAPSGVNRRTSTHSSSTQRDDHEALSCFRAVAAAAGARPGPGGLLSSPALPLP